MTRENRFVNSADLPDPPEVKLGMENWLPFTFRVISRALGYHPPTKAFESPVDFGSNAEKIMRQGDFPSATRPFPYPYMIGAIGGGMPMQDELSWRYAWGRTPSGPGIGTPVMVPFATTYPDLSKKSG